MCRLSLWTLLVSLSVVGFGGAGAQAQGTCERLWIERNSIFKAYGYCFKTARSIRHFGNAGCQYDNLEDVPLSQAQQRVIAGIVRDVNHEDGKPFVPLIFRYSRVMWLHMDWLFDPW